MKLLVIDTSVASTLVIAAVDDRCFAVDSLPEPGSNTSRNIIPYVDRALQAFSLSVADLDCVAVAVGPGSFTGLRIGVSVANAFLTAGVKVLPVDLLQMLCFGEPQGCLAALPSRPGFCYTTRGELSLEAVAQEPCSVGVEHTGCARVLQREEYRAKLLSFARAHAAEAASVPAEPLYLKKSQAERLRENKND